MPKPTCLKCNSHTFQLATLSPAGSNFKYQTVMCSSCGTVVGITDFYNIGETLRVLENMVLQIGEKLEIRMQGVTW